MAWIGWSLRANIFRTGLAGPTINSRIQLIRKHVRCLCDTAHSFRDFSTSRGLEDITVVDKTRGAVRVVQTLLQLPVEQSVSWSTQLCMPSDRKSPDEFLLSVSAYAGDDVNFGNGPHLFICSEDEHESEAIWNLLRKYFQTDDCEKVWFDYPQSMRALALMETKPKGFGGDITQMARLYRDKQRKMQIDTIAKAMLTKTNINKSNELWHKNDVPNEERMKRPWDDVVNFGGAGITDQWITRACYEASLIHRLDKRLRKLLAQASIQGDAYAMPAGTSSVHRNENVFNQLQAYETFFKPLSEAFYAVETEGLPVDFGILEHVVNREEHAKKLMETDFRKWASTFSKDALYMDINSTRQMRQLLFAPCENIHNVKSKLEQSAKFKLNRLRLHDISGTQNLKDKKEIVIKGAGITAISHTKQGWPSVSASALRKAQVQYRRNPGKRVPENFDEAMDNLLRSLEIGKRLKWYATMTDFTRIQGEDGRIQMKYRMDPYTGKLVTSADGKDWESLVQKCIYPSHGNDVIVIHFWKLGLWTLAMLSGCTSLYGRLMTGGGTTMLLASELFVLSSAYDSGTAFPEVSSVQCNAARMLDKAMCRGGDISFVEKHTECSKEEATRLVKEWYDLHPGVLKWQREREAFIIREGFAETYMGRRRKLKKGQTGEGIGFIVNGTSAELIADSVLSLQRDERIKSLGWRVAHLDLDKIVLEGPTYAADSILDFLENVVKRPTAFEVDEPHEVNLYHRKAGDNSELIFD